MKIEPKIGDLILYGSNVGILFQNVPLKENAYSNFLIIKNLKDGYFDSIPFAWFINETAKIIS